MVQSNTSRRISSPELGEFDELELLLGRRATTGSHQAQPASTAGSPTEAELLGLIRRSLAGEPFPLSGPRQSTAAPEALPLALRIREILRTEQEKERTAADIDEAAPSELSVPPAELAPPEAPLRLGTPLIAVPSLDTETPAPAAAPRLTRPTIGWGSAAFVLLIAVGGACVPGIIAAPPRFAAEARLQALGVARATPGFLEATALRATSPRLLSQVVTKLKLDHDAEFSGGKATAYSVIMDLLTDSGAASDNFSRAQLALQQRLTVTPDRQSGTVMLVAQSGDPKKSARIANLLADIAVRDAAAKPFASPPSEAELAVEGERKHYDAANAALSAFKTAAGDDKIAAATQLMESKDALAAQITTASKAAQAASIRLSAAKAVRMTDVLDGSISPDLGSPPALEDLRNRYAAAKSTLGQLSTQLGPRHPRLLAAQSIIDTLGGAILAEIQKMVIASDAEMKATANQLRQLKVQLAALNGQTVDVDLATFGQLQSDVEAARQSLEAATAAETAKPAAAASEVPLALSTPAVPPVAAMDDNLIRRALIGGAFGGLVALALIACRRLVGRLFRETASDDTLVDFDVGDLLAGLAEVDATPPVAQATPQQKFEAAIAAANALPQKLAEGKGPEADMALNAIIGDVASLRAKVATYVSQRQAAGR
ncbi:MAG: hypothetical protein ABWY49_08660 [Rhizobium sp.]